MKHLGAWCSVIPRSPGSGWPGTAGGCAGCLSLQGAHPLPSARRQGKFKSEMHKGVHAALHHDRRSGAAPAPELGRCTHYNRRLFSKDKPHEIRPKAALGALSRDHRRAAAPLVLRYHLRRRPGASWQAAQLRLRRGRGLIVVDTRDVATLKAGMQSCENAARNEGYSRSLAT